MTSKYIGVPEVKAGIESAIAEGARRNVTFDSAFSVTPYVVVSFADDSDEHSVCSAHSISTTGFTISVTSAGGVGGVNRDVSWFATDAGRS